MYFSPTLSLFLLGSFLSNMPLAAPASIKEIRQDATTDDQAEDDPLQIAEYPQTAQNTSREIFIPLLLSRYFINSRIQGYCFKRLSLAPAPGTSSGFKGWRQKYTSGYVVLDKKLYFFFRCDKPIAIRRVRRVKRGDDTPPPPRPCETDDECENPAPTPTAAKEHN